MPRTLPCTLYSELWEANDELLLVVDTDIFDDGMKWAMGLPWGPGQSTQPADLGLGLGLSFGERASAVLAPRQETGLCCFRRPDFNADRFGDKITHPTEAELFACRLPLFDACLALHASSRFFNKFTSYKAQDAFLYLVIYVFECSSLFSIDQAR